MFLLYGGGLLAAFLFMLAATFRLQKLSRLIVYLVLAASALFAQGGCWHVASGIGRATGSSDSPGRDWDSFGLVSGSVVVFALWAATLIAVRIWRSPSSVVPPESDPSKGNYDY